MDAKKKNISLRVSQQDLERVKQISTRMNVKEADLIRFAIKQVLNSLVPFQEETYKGVDLLPVLVDMGPELSSFFELSCSDLDLIVNGSAQNDDQRFVKNSGREIEIEDLRLISLFGANQEYAMVKLSQSMAVRNDAIDEPLDLKHYLNHKYLPARSASESMRKADGEGDVAIASYQDY